MAAPTTIAEASLSGSVWLDGPLDLTAAGAVPGPGLLDPAARRDLVFRWVDAGGTLHDGAVRYGDVPEPAAAVLLTAGAATLLPGRRRFVSPHLPVDAASSVCRTR